MAQVKIICPNGRTLPLVGAPSAPTVRFTRWRDLLALPFWPTYVFGVGFAKQRILADDTALDALLAGGGSPNVVLGWIMRFFALFGQLPAFRRRTQQRSIEDHYGLSNQYYLLQLSGGTADGDVGEPGDMAYSCARPLSPNGSIKRDQLRKLLDIFFKLGLFNHAPGSRREEWLLDIGCGWGDLSVLAACLFGVRVLGITLSEAQADRARKLAQAFNVAHLVTIEVMNYQDLPRSKYAGIGFKYITSVGMFEHVSRRHQRRFFGIVRRVLAPDGVALLHCIVRQVPGSLDLWVRKKIFPHGFLAAAYKIDRQLARHGFFVAQVDYLWEEYAITLEHWLAAHVANRERIIADLGMEFFLERLLWLKGSISAFRCGGRPGARQQGLKVGQWLFAAAKPAPGTWRLGHRTDVRLLEHFVSTLMRTPARLV